LMIVPMTATVVVVMKYKFSYLSNSSSSFNTRNPAVMTNISIAFYPQASCSHVHRDSYAVRMVRATSWAHHGQHSHVLCHHPGV
jgi:hypothetical protein